MSTSQCSIEVPPHAKTSVNWDNLSRFAAQIFHALRLCCTVPQDVVFIAGTLTTEIESASVCRRRFHRRNSNGRIQGHLGELQRQDPRSPQLPPISPPTAQESQDLGESNCPLRRFYKSIEVLGCSRLTDIVEGTPMGSSTSSPMK
ncbi:hypothetical protein NDU88_002058 [Pleurodeles waltl]|uniref:Uncharacterized protein n=1 Tax=Pleurodeles waltl TaxID=8319 RepID=A0AAV7UA62_PLEWA|nr:hypothetical protein NDU88_002058 [Pleurodeles waltl]